MNSRDVYIVGICFIQADIHCNYLPIFLALFDYHDLYFILKVFIFKFSDYSECRNWPLLQSTEWQAQEETECYHNNVLFLGLYMRRKINFSHAAERMGTTCWATQLFQQKTAISEADLTKTMLIKYNFYFVLNCGTLNLKSKSFRLNGGMWASWNSSWPNTDWPFLDITWKKAKYSVVW